MFRTCDLSDANPSASVCELQMRDLGKRRAFEGEIRTVRCYEDNALIRQVLSTQSTGEVLVVDGGGSLRTSLLGDQLATLASENGWAGVVIWGAVRDTVALVVIDIGVKALGTVPRRSAKQGTGELDVPVLFGGVTFHPGDHLYADEDGILTLPGAWHP